MSGVMKAEFRKIRTPALTTTISVAAIMTLLCCTLYRGYAIQYKLEAWEIGTGIFDFIFPLLVVIPLCWSLYYERKDHYLLYVSARIPLRKYLESKWCVQALSAFAICFIPYFLSAVISVCSVSFMPDDYNITSFRHIFQTLFTGKPILYALMLSAWKGLIAILVMSMGFVLSMYMDNIFLVLTGPFVYCVLENFVFSILMVERFRLMTAFSPSSLDPRAISAASFFTGPMVLFLVTALIWLVCTKGKRQSVLEV